MNTLPFNGTVGPHSPANYSLGMVLQTEHAVFGDDHEFIRNEHRTGVVVDIEFSTITVEYAGGVRQAVLPMHVYRVLKG